MHEHHGVARVQRVHHRIERRIAEEFSVVAREQADAAELQRVERKRDLGDRVAHVAHRHGAERAEAFRPLALSSAA